MIRDPVRSSEKSTFNFEGSGDPLKYFLKEGKRTCYGQTVRYRQVEMRLRSE